MRQLIVLFSILLLAWCGATVLTAGTTKATTPVQPRKTPPQETVHLVKKGETLFGIARKHGTTVDRIKALNKLKSNAISAGTKLRIPPGEPAEKPASQSETGGRGHGKAPAARTISINKAQRPAVIQPECQLAKSGDEATIVIDLSAQRGYLLSGGKVLVDTPVSTGRKGHRTPAGEFRISERIESGKVSTLYAAAMPLWQRLGATPYGIHVGVVPGYPASHGCVRLPRQVAPIFFAKAKTGTKVRIVEDARMTGADPASPMIVAAAADDALTASPEMKVSLP